MEKFQGELTLGSRTSREVNTDITLIARSSFNDFTVIVICIYVMGQL